MQIKTVCWSLMSLILVGQSLSAQEKNPELTRFQGHWEVIELAEDGKVIPKEAIKEWLPSGGKLEIVDNAIIFRSPDDGKKHVKLFSIDATQSPKGVEIITKEGKDAWGIFRFDDNQLVICMSDPEGKRPTEFSAKAGSKHLLMTLERQNAENKPAASATKPEPKGIVAKPLTDTEVQSLLKGTWVYRDSAGSLYVTYTADGHFNTVREVQELRLFQKAFVQTPVSSGTWAVKNGQLLMTVTASRHPDKVNHNFPFAVRSISDKDLIFVDYLGRVGQAARVR